MKTYNAIFLSIWILFSLGFVTGYKYPIRPRLEEQGPGVVAAAVMAPFTCGLVCGSYCKTHSR